jgi:hypothetical protein
MLKSVRLLGSVSASPLFSIYLVTQKSPKPPQILGDFGRVTQKSPNANATTEKSAIPEN